MTGSEALGLRGTATITRKVWWFGHPLARARRVRPGETTAERTILASIERPVPGIIGAENVGG